MSLKSRLIFLVLALLSISIVVVSIVLGWSARMGTFQQTESDGLVIAQLLARGAGVLDKVPEDVEHLIGEQMVVQAMFAARLVAVAEMPMLTASQIVPYLKEIISKTALSEVTITNEKGEAYIQTTPTPLPFVFEKYSKVNPKWDDFYPLLTGEKTQVIQDAYVRDDEKIFKYVGVGGSDKPRVVQIGYNFRFLNEMKQRLGFQRLVEGLLASQAANAIWIVNNQLETLAYGALSGVNADKTPSEIELDHLEQVITEGKTISFFHDHLLKVMSPIIGKDGTIVGAALVQLPTSRLQSAMTQQLQLAALVAICALIIGGAFTYLMAKWVSRPVEIITMAAASVEQGNFDPEILDELIERQDELGRLARVFQAMGHEVVNREERLDAMVKVRTRELEIKTLAVEAALEELKSTQTQLVAKEKMASLGQLTSGIAHELKNPLNFVINFSGVTKETANELYEEIEKQKDKIPEKDLSYINDLVGDITQNSEKIYEHGKNAEIIINSMIQHASSDHGAQQFINFNKLVTESTDFCFHSLRGKEAAFNFSVSYDLDKEIQQIELIPQGINRVIHYLLDNAHYAIHEKAEKLGLDFKPEIRITSKDEGKMVELRIWDNGIGIPESIRDKIFNPFFTTKPTRQGNTGMGLSLCFDIIVQQHLGQIEFNSVEGEYSEFVIKLPKISPATNAV